MGFVTGSHKYGKPTSSSDIDVVIYMPLAELELLLFISDNKERGSGDSPDITQASLMFGNRLNLIIHTDPEKYRLWKEATETCRAMPPLDREEAVKIFKRICKDDEPE
jgi:predicted nucleotidyltransferase